MKTKPTSALCLLLLATCLWPDAAMAQYYEGFNYQAVIRDASGDPLVNHAVTVRFSIHQNSAEGAIVFREAHATTTNEYGLVNLTIGEGTPLIGSFPTLQWYWYTHYLQVETDIGGGFVNLGSQQFESVPYAKAAYVAAYATDMVLNDLNDVSYPFYLSDGMTLVWSEADESWIADAPGESYWESNGADTYVPSGNVGIGITNPSQRLHIHTDVGAPRTRYTNNITGTSIIDGSEIGLGITGEMHLINWEPSDMVFSTAIGEKLRIKSNGNIGIGTQIPANLLHLHVDLGGNTYAQFTNGSSGYTTTDGALVGFGSDGTMKIANQENSSMGFLTNNTTRMTISAAGDVGIGDSTPDAKLDVAGDIVATSLDVSSSVEGGSLKGVNLGFGGNRDVYADNNGVLQVAPSATYYYSIPACEFDVSTNSDVGSADTDTDFEIEYEPHMFDIQEDWGVYYYAPIHLPHGAHISSFFATVYDAASDQNIVVGIIAKNVYTGSYGDVGFEADVSSTGSSGNQTLTTNYTFNGVIIDNAYNTYFARVNLSGDAGSPSSEEMKIIAVVISYTLHP